MRNDVTTNKKYLSGRASVETVFFIFFISPLALVKALPRDRRATALRNPIYFIPHAPPSQSNSGNPSNSPPGQAPSCPIASRSFNCPPNLNGMLFSLKCEHRLSSRGSTLSLDWKRWSVETKQQIRKTKESAMQWFTATALKYLQQINWLFCD